MGLENAEKSYNFKIFFILSVFARYSKTLYHFLIETKGFQKKNFLNFFIGYKGVRNGPKIKILGQNTLIFDFWAISDPLITTKKLKKKFFLKALGLYYKLV